MFQFLLMFALTFIPRKGYIFYNRYLFFKFLAYTNFLETLALIRFFSSPPLILKCLETCKMTP